LQRRFPLCIGWCNKGTEDWDNLEVIESTARGRSNGMMTNSSSDDKGVAATNRPLFRKPDPFTSKTRKANSTSESITSQMTQILTCWMKWTTIAPILLACKGRDGPEILNCSAGAQQTLRMQANCQVQESRSFYNSPCDFEHCSAGYRHSWRPLLVRTLR
jgi:hypothetical protein